MADILYTARNSWQIESYIPGLPVFTHQRVLRLVAREFFRDTRVWRVELPATTLAADTSEATVDWATAVGEVPDPSIIHVWHAYLAGATSPLQVQSQRWLEGRAKDFWNHKGRPDTVVHVRGNILRLYPQPGQEYTLSGAVSIAPGLAATGIPDYVFDEFYEPLLYGALARMFAMPEAQYNTDLASYYATLYEDSRKKLTTIAQGDRNGGNTVLYGGL